MKKLLFLFLLCIFSAFMSDKNEKLESQLGDIQKQALKWHQELNDFKKWDADNNGILDDSEKEALESRKKEIILILKRMADITKLKNLNLPFAGIVEKMLEKTLSDSALDIPKKGFVEVVEEVINNFKMAILELKSNESLSVLIIRNDYTWDSKFIFSTHNDQIVIDLKADFLIVLNKSGGKTLGELADSLYKMLSKYNKDYISKYYAKDYKGKAITESIIKGMFPSAADLKKGIESGIDKNDPNHPEIKAAEEADFQKFKDSFVKAISKEKDKIESISVSGDTAFLDFRIIDADRLIINKGEINVPVYAQGFKDWMVNSLYNIAKNKKISTVAEIKRKAKILLTDYCTEVYLKNLYQEYKKNKNDSDPTGFASWINQSTSSIDLTSFEKHFKKGWADNVISAVDSFQRDLKSKGLNFKAERSLLHNNLKRILGVGIGKNNVQPGLEVHKKFMELLPADKVLDYTVIDTIWEKAIAESIKPDFMSNLCSNYFIEGSANLYDIEFAINSIDTILPNIDAIVVELYNSKYYPKPIPIPKSENPLMIRVKIKKRGREKQFMDLVLDIPLRFEIRKGKNAEMLYNPIPTLDLSDVTVRNAFGFSVSKVQNVYVGKTADVTKNGFLETTTDYCWRLSIVDSSEQTVIQEPEIGELVMIDASMGKLTGLDEVGIDPLGFQVKFVGNEYGHTDKILGKITLMGMPFIVGWGKEGAIGYFENPMAFKEAELQYKYGSQNSDLYISCRVNTFIGADYSIKVDVNNIQLGMQNGAFIPEGLNLDKKLSQFIMIEKTGKVE